MKLKVVVHEAEEGGYWAEVPALPGCVSQGETMDELLRNIHEAVEGCLELAARDIKVTDRDRILEIAVRMKGVSGKRLARLLEDHGWELKRITGSNISMPKPDDRNVSRYPFTGMRR